jgi:hypothetical protein
VSVAWWLWPQVLCFDAPLVAMAWMAALAKSHHLRLQPSFYIGLGLVTWIVYVLDRTADAVSGRLQAPLSARHEFCLRHQKLLLRVLVPLAAIYLLWLGLTDVPQRLLVQGLGLCVAGSIYLAAYSARRGGLRTALFSVAGIAGLAVVNLMPLPPMIRNALAGALVFAVLSAIRSQSQERARSALPKEVIASLLFALGCSAGVHFWTPPEHSTLCPEVTMLWGLVLLNLMSIQWSESVRGEHGEKAQASPGAVPWTASFVTMALVCFSAQVWMTTVDAGERATAVVALSSALIVGILLVMARRLPTQVFHFLVDAAVVIPLPFLWWLV